MYFDENKIVLFVIGMEHKLEGLLQQATNIDPENMLVLKIYGPVISQPYGDLMRDIIVAVYQENAEEIFIVGTKDSQENTVDIQDLLNKICKREGLKGQIQTLDYLFQNCIPEFPGGNVSEWLEGSKTVTEGIQKSVNIIRHHPFIPSHVKVHGLYMNRENGKLTEIDVS
jgi:carbonic anhydrase